MRTGWWWLLVGGALLASACTPSRPVPGAITTSPTASGTAAVAPQYRRTGPQGNGAATGQIARVGAALSLSGPMKLFGEAQRSGIKLAQDEINANQLLGTTRLEVIVEDDGSDRDQASAAFQRFIENSHVLAIIGPTTSDVALSVDPLAQQAGVPVLGISNAAGGLTELGDFIFRDCLSESQLTPGVINAVRKQIKLRNAALLYGNTDPSRAGSHGFKIGLQNAGIQIASEQVFESDQTDFTPQLEEIAASRPDALFVSAPPHTAASLLRQARVRGLERVPIIGNNAFNSDTVLHAAGDAAEGLIVASAWSAADLAPANQRFIQSYRARYGVDPDQVAAQAYSGVYILAAAINKAHTSTDQRAVRDALEHVHGVETPLGPFSFNARREANYPPVIQIVHQGQFQRL